MKKESFFNEYQCVVLIDFRTTKQFIENICIVHRSEKMLTINQRSVVIIGRLIYHVEISSKQLQADSWTK